MGQIMVVAGEPSGDLHAARVVREIKKIKSDIDFVAMGSEALRQEGANILVDPMQISSIGFVKVFKNLRTHLSHIRLLKEYMRNNRPDLLFLVDYSGFNMLMARIGEKMNIPVVNYFPPTAWVWGEWRAKWMARYNAVIAATLPMEEKIYKKSGADVKFVGHPLLDIVEVDKSKEQIASEFELNLDKPIIALMPGSRRAEVEELAPEMFRAAEKLQAENPEFQFVLPLAQGVDRDLIAGQAGSYNLILKIIEDASYEVMKISDLVVTASGTAALESMILETPMIVVYKTDWTTYQLGTRLMNTDYISLPNIIAGKEIVPEFIQGKVTAENIYDKVNYFLNRAYILREKSKKLGELRDKLGDKGAVRRTAELLLEEGGL